VGCRRLPQLEVYIVPHDQLAQAPLTARARAYAMALADCYLAAVPVAALVGGWATAKVAGDVARTVVSVQRLQAAKVVVDVVPAVTGPGVLVVPWQGEEIEKAVGSKPE
jgi:hypothetical protein